MTEENYQGRKKYTMIQGRGGNTYYNPADQSGIVPPRPKNSATNFTQVN